MNIMSKALFPTTRQENFRSQKYRVVYSLFPIIYRSGVKVNFLSSDFQEMHISLRKRLFTKNIVGSVFGGFIYASVDPHYMTMLMMILGRDYVVWDKSAEIEFIKPIYKTAICKFEITDEQVKEIKDVVAQEGKCFYDFTCTFVDKDSGQLHAKIEKKVYIASKAHYEQRKKAKEAQASSAGN